MGVFILTYRTWQSFPDICSTLVAFVLIKVLTVITDQIEHLNQYVMGLFFF